jgi:branched-chain amino acid transport system permease protein
VLAGILIGMAQSFTAPYIYLNTIIIYLITVIILLVRPRGLLGAKGVFE